MSKESDDWADGLSRSIYPAITSKLDGNGSRNLTEEMLTEAFEKMRTQEPQYCVVHYPHTVNFTALKRGGYTMCANCLSVVYLG